MYFDLSNLKTWLRACRASTWTDVSEMYF